MKLYPIIFLLILLLCSAQSCSLHRKYHSDTLRFPREIDNASVTAQPGHDLLKRWYGVKPLPPAPQNYLSPYYYPWPITCSSPKPIQPIRYCFKDARSAKNLQIVVDRAIAFWSQAMLVSSFTITVEPTCRNKFPCLCSDSGVAKDALMISDEIRDKDEEWNQGPDCYTASTVGYRYIPKGQPDVPHRHYSTYIIVSFSYFR